MSRAPILNSCAPAPVAMSKLAATKMAAVTNTKISLAMVVIIVLLRYARWTIRRVEKQSDANTAGDRRDCGYGRTLLRLPLRGARTIERTTGNRDRLFRHSLNTRQ